MNRAASAAKAHAHLLTLLLLAVAASASSSLSSGTIAVQRRSGAADIAQQQRRRHRRRNLQQQQSNNVFDRHGSSGASSTGSGGQQRRENGGDGTTTGVVTTASVPLQPFQVLYTTAGVARTYQDMEMNEMVLLRVTRQHLQDCLLGKRQEQQQQQQQQQQGDDAFRTDTIIDSSSSSATSSLQRIDLYETIRSDEALAFHNATKFAFMGTAYYGSSQQNDESTQQQQQQLPPPPPSSPSPYSNECLCFLGGNETLYVESLREAGWTTLDRAWLMTPSGQYVWYTGKGQYILVSADGRNGGTASRNDGGGSSNDNGGEGTDGNNGVDDDSMMEGMSKTMYVLAVLIPIGVVGVMSIVTCIAWIKYSVKWDRTADNYDNDGNSDNGDEQSTANGYGQRHPLGRRQHRKQRLATAVMGGGGGGRQVRPHPVWELSIPESAELRKKALEMELYLDVENERRRLAQQNADGDYVDGDYAYDADDRRRTSRSAFPVSAARSDIPALAVPSSIGTPASSGDSSRSYYTENDDAFDDDPEIVREGDEYYYAGEHWRTGRWGR